MQMLIGKKTISILGSRERKIAAIMQVKWFSIYRLESGKFDRN